MNEPFPAMLRDFMASDDARDLTGSYGFTTTEGDKFRGELFDLAVRWSESQPETNVWVRRTEWGWVVESATLGDTVPTVRSGYLKTRREAEKLRHKLLCELAAQ